MADRRAVHACAALDFPRRSQRADCAMSTCSAPRSSSLRSPSRERPAGRSICPPAPTGTTTGQTNGSWRPNHQGRAPIDSIPLFVRAGSILPLGDAIESTSQGRTSPKSASIPAPMAISHSIRMTEPPTPTKRGRRITHLHWNDATQKLTIRGRRRGRHRILKSWMWLGWTYIGALENHMFAAKVPFPNSISGAGGLADRRRYLFASQCARVG